MVTSVYWIFNNDSQYYFVSFFLILALSRKLIFQLALLSSKHLPTNNSAPLHSHDLTLCIYKDKYKPICEDIFSSHSEISKLIAINMHLLISLDMFKNLCCWIINGKMSVMFLSCPLLSPDRLA